MIIERDAPTRGKAANILLVDDNPGKLLTYEVVLGGLGQRLIQACSVDEALQALLREDVALIVTDVSMPGLDGFALAELVQNHPRFCAVPIIFVSAIADSDPDRLRGYASGAVDYVTAPFHPELLRAKVKVFLDLYCKQQELTELKRQLEQRVAERTAELETSTRLLSESEVRYRSLFETANDIVVTFDRDFRLVSINPAVRVLGYTPEELVGRPLADFIARDRRGIQLARLHRELGGEDAKKFEMELDSKDGRRRLTLEVSSKLMLDRDGNPVGIHAIARDITDRKEAEARQNVLINELQHRTKNLLAVAQSIVTNTIAASPTTAAAKNAIIGRLHALARAQEFVASNGSSGVPLRDLVEAELSAFSARLSVDGVPLMLGSAFAQQFALVIHELATNAAKYGSLSTPRGRVLVAWQISRQRSVPELEFSWRELDGPQPNRPASEGFGSRLILAVLGNNAQRHLGDQGLEFSARVPLSEVRRAST